MFSDERKEPGTPKFGKLHIPFGLWINSPKKHFVKLGKRWPSAGSVKSTSSETGSRTSETVELRQPGRARASRSKRVSQIFARPRWSSERKLAEAGEGELGPSPGEEEVDAAAPGEDELSVQPGAPGVLKIFGEHICTGANYKSVLATARSSAGGLVKEVLARYAMADQPPSHFLLCEVLGRADGPAGNWQPQCLRAVGDSERPLVLQEMWRPRRGLARRFEIRRRSQVERTSREESEDTVTEGINAQARRLQRSRARVSAGDGAPQGDAATLRRSISEANLSGQRKRERKGVKSVLVLDGAAPGQPDTKEAESGRQGLTFENVAQSLVRPPANVPYFLVLQGHNEEKDLVLHLMTRKRHVFGRGGRQAGSEQVDTALAAPDILPRHCCVLRPPEGCRDPPLPARVRPLPGARVTLNGGVLLGESELHSGDLLGLGEHYLLMYREPGPASSSRPSWLPAPPAVPGPPPRAFFSCLLCGRALQDEEEAYRAYLGSRLPLLRFRPEAEEEEALLEEIARGAKGEDGAGLVPAGDGDAYNLAPAYLFAICLQFAACSLGPSQLPALLIRTANVVKRTAWEKIKEIGDRQTENQSQEGQQPPARPLEDVTSDLRPLMFWMSNSIELLNFAQKKVAELEKDWENAQTDGFSHDPVLGADFEACEEAMSILDEVIMYTFQQCVYYLTKTLYSVLPSLLETNPFATSANPADVQDLSRMPEGVRDILKIYQTTFDLSQEYLVHPDLVSQMFGYLFFFSNASAFNALMEKGEGGSFYQWARGVQIRTNLDLILDWLQREGLGDIAAEYFRKLSATVNLLCIPKTSLLKMSWDSLQEDHQALSPAQLSHVLRNYHLGPGRPRPTTWSAMPTHADKLQKGEIFASFTDHPPLILPSENFRLCLASPVPSEDFYARLQHLRAFLWEREKQRVPANQRTAIRL